MDLTWLRYVVDGGALVLLAVVLFGGWKLAQQFIGIMQQMVDQMQANIRVQEQLSSNVAQSCKLVSDHETRTLGRLAEYEQRTQARDEDHEEKAVVRHREAMRKLSAKEKP